MRNSLLISLVAASCGLLFVAGCSAPTGSNSNNGSATSNAAGNPKIVAARDLTEAFEKDERAAVEKYGGKTLTVSGRVLNIGETAENATVSLFGHHTMTKVVSSFAEAEKSGAAKLQKNQAVTLVCTGGAMKTGFDVGLKECKVQ